MSHYKPDLTSRSLDDEASEQLSKQQKIFMEEKAIQSIDHAAAFKSLMELHLMFRTDNVTQKSLAQEIGISEHLMGKILNGHIKNLSWTVKMKLMKWCEENRKNSHKNTPAR